MLLLSAAEGMPLVFNVQAIRLRMGRLPRFAVPEKETEKNKMTIKAIETSYKGYRFRSRLEARWAVFFDVLAFEWTYEEEGFDLGDEWYLPDFSVKSPEKMFVEIKPGDMNFDEFTKCRELSSLGTVLAIQGNPWPGEYKLHLFSPDSDYDLEDAEFGTCRKCAALCILLRGDRIGYRQLESCYRFECENVGNKYPLGAEFLSKCKSLYRPIAAFHAARSARFEHGESPR